MSRIGAMMMAWALMLGIGPLHAQPRPLVVASISSDPADEMKDWLPFARLLGAELAKDGISEGKVVVARDVNEIVALLKARRVDLYIDSPIVMLDVVNATGSKLLARRWKNGSAEYTSLIFARKDSGIASLADLKSKVIAFQKDNSSTGYLLPRMEMENAGLKLEFMAGLTDLPPPGRIGYRFSGADKNTVAWVFHRHVSAGATSGEDWAKVSPEQRAEMAIIFETAPIPRHIVAHGGHLPPALVARIKQVLLQMDQNPKAKDVLAKFERTTKFDDISRETRDTLARYAASMQRAELIR